MPTHDSRLVVDLAKAYKNRNADREMVRRALEVPELGAGWRAGFEKLLRHDA